MMNTPRWLFLIHQLPKEPAYLRVKVGRRLTRVGALALKNSVYVLPNTDATAEDFQWIRKEILEGGGEATLLGAHLVEGLSDEEIETRFRVAKDTEYDAVILEARELRVSPGGRRKRALSDEERGEALSAIARLERQLQELAVTDFFAAAGREVASGLLRELRSQLEPPDSTPAPNATAAQVRARTWVTRTGIRVDRIASAWLVRRFIDPQAVFKFVSAAGYVHEAQELRFDMSDAEYTHEGDACTFEVLCARFKLNDTGLRALAELVHDLDVKDGKFARPEAPGLAAQIAGLTQLHRQDEARLARGSELFDELYAYFSNKKP